MKLLKLCIILNVIGFGFQHATSQLSAYANTPTQVYLTGVGSEAGDNLADAMELKSVEEGVFEIYAELTTDGSFTFVDANSGDPNEFNIDNGDLVEGGDAPVIDQNGVYRLTLDFNTDSASITRINEVGLFQAAHNDVVFDFEYQGNGVFLAEEKPFEFFQFEWGRDERYKFRLSVSQDGVDSYEWFGYSEVDSHHRPDGSTPESYWHLNPVDDSQWNYTFKMATEMDESIIDVYVYFSADIDNYTHEVIKVEPTSSERKVDAERPGQFYLEQNYPNPFNPATQIAFNIPEASNVTLEVFNIQGQHITTLVDGNLSAGRHQVSFDGSDLSSGIYMYRIQSNHQVETRIMTLIK